MLKALYTYGGREDSIIKVPQAVMCWQETFLLPGTLIQSIEQIIEGNDQGVERVFDDGNITRDYFDTFEKVQVKPGCFDMFSALTS